MLTCNKIEKEVLRRFNEVVEVEKDKDYIYLVYDKGNVFNTRSVYVPRLNYLDMEGWMFEAKALLELN